jgi:hypothetical protein
MGTSIPFWGESHAPDFELNGSFHRPVWNCRLTFSSSYDSELGRVTRRLGMLQGGELTGRCSKIPDWLTFVGHARLLVNAAISYQGTESHHQGASKKDDDDEFVPHSLARSIILRRDIRVRLINTRIQFRNRGHTSRAIGGVFHDAVEG